MARADKIAAYEERAQTARPWLEDISLMARLGKRPARRSNWMALGTREFEAGRLLRARQFFEKAHRTEPRNAAPLIKLARTQERIGEIDAAIVNLTRAIKLKPDDERPRVRCRASCAGRAGRLQRSGPGRPEGRARRAECGPAAAVRSGHQPSARCSRSGRAHRPRSRAGRQAHRRRAGRTRCCIALSPTA